MDITPEERQRIYEEEKARIEIRTQIQGDARKTTRKRSLKAFIGLAAFLIVAGGAYHVIRLTIDYNNVTQASVDAQVAAQRDAQYQQAQAALQAARSSYDNSTSADNDPSEDYMHSGDGDAADATAVGNARGDATAARIAASDTHIEADGAKLNGLSQTFYVEDDYCIVDGEVKNISPNSMADVDAIATFYDKDHNVVKTADALIKYNPILPGQTSPFQVITTNNPAIKTEIMTFAYLNGSEIPMRHH